MAGLKVELPADVHRRLAEAAGKAGKPIEQLAADWLAERLPAEPMTERERARQVLREAGLLSGLTPAEQERARRCTATLEEVSAALSRAGGKPLSEIVIEQRGPKQ